MSTPEIPNGFRRVTEAEFFAAFRDRWGITELDELIESLAA